MKIYGTIFNWWDEAVEWAHKRAASTGVRQTVKVDRAGWRVAPR